MLRSFRVENHKSIGGEAEFLLMPVYDKAQPVVPVTAIFGANAAGKSNLLDALCWMRHAVLDSFRTWEPDRGVPRCAFKLDPETRWRPSLFATELLLAGVRYMYGFTVDDERVTEEWLYTYPHNRRRVVFVRRGDGWEFGSTVARTKLEQVAELTPRNGLFLSTAARTEVEEVAPVFRWFQQAVTFIDHTTSWRTELEVYLAGADHSLLIDLVQAADLGIRDIRQDRGESEGLSQQLNVLIDRLAPVEVESSLQFLHGGNETPLTEGEQSFGTRAWLRVVVHTLRALERGSVLCVDEIDSSLHPRLTARLIELFRDEGTNPHRAQLIFTTHDATLLGTSFGVEILKRDEVWFVEKDADSSTRLFSLSDFKPRKDENTERRYLGGSYGAVPAVYSETLVERYRAAREQQRAAA